MVSHLNAFARRTVQAGIRGQTMPLQVLITNPHFKALGINTIEAKQRRVILMASDDVHDLQNFKYTSTEQLYGEYARQCDVFE